MSAPDLLRSAAWLRRTSLCGLVALGLAGTVQGASVEEQLQEIVAQNRKLQDQVQAQQRLIDALSSQVAEMRGTSAKHERELQTLQERQNEPAPERSEVSRGGMGGVRVSGEMGLAFLRTGGNGLFPNSDFRLDDVKLFVEAQVWKDVYAFTELNLFLREFNDEALHLGEVYVDFENVSKLWHVDNLVNLRAGRFNIPFGEEYQTRGVMRNPLISHSLSDIWGTDEGIEIYGSAGKFQYVAAIQNGGHSLLHDFNSDKALIGRIGYAPQSWLRVSASAMRTGDLSVKDDVLSEVWFGNAFFRQLGAPASTLNFHADLYEVDATVKWHGGQALATAGRADFDDDDVTRSNARRLKYHSFEVSQDVGEKLYFAARYSDIRVPRGYPLVAWGNYGKYFYSGVLTERLERLSLGLGYRIGPPLVLKFEYGLESGRTTSGAKREHEDFFSTEVGLKF
ncbi:MAG: hypothetical protein ABIS43_17325 [Opitutus sp.]